MTDADELGADGPPDDDLGEPVVELEQLSLTVRDRFGQRVRGGIERRLLAGHVLDLLWTGPIAVFLEFVGAALGLARSGRKS
jgi:hypothetical protein